MIRTALIIGLAGLPAAAGAETLALPPGAVLTAEAVLPEGDFAFAVGPWTDGRIERLAVRGAVQQRAWRIANSGQTSLQLATFLSDQLSAQGFSILYQCRDVTCGGYDFRFATQVVGEPAMHVDLGDYRYLAARRTADQAGAEDDYVSLLVSRSPGAGYVQIVQSGAEEALQTVTTPVTSSMTDPAATADETGQSLAAQLEGQGHAVLADLEFATGSSDLGLGPFATLADLAAYLALHPQARVALVGHTDAEGALTANIALSRRRAGSVMARLIEVHGVDPDQLSAEGIGYLAPMGTNRTEAGRTKNRRVEVVLTTTR